MPRSGTTVIFEYFAQHEQLAWLSQYSNRLPYLQAAELIPGVFDHPSLELRARKSQGQKRRWYERYLPRPVEGYPFWSYYCGESFLWDAFPEKALTEKSVRDTRNAVGKIVAYRRKSRFAAKFTGPSRVVALNRIFPDALFVHVIRDGRAVVDSLLRVPFWKEKGGHLRPFWRDLLTSDDVALIAELHSDPIALAAVQWLRVIALTREDARAIAGNRYMELKYEDFVDSPLSSLQAVFRFSGLPDSGRVSRYIENMPVSENMNYKYRKLPQDQVDLMNVIMGDGLELCGYQRAATGD